MTVADLSSYLSATIGLLIVSSAMVFAIMGIDDALLDVAYWAHRWYRWLVARHFKRLTVDQLREKDQKRIAIFIPCWHEHEVVDKSVELACNSVRYTNYDIYIGVYPNDPLTIEKAEQVAKRFPRVQVVINERDGPTTKAQNLNQMWNAMLQREGTNPYDIMVLHDVEDVIHPISLMLYNFLIPRRDMVQLPVFPLERSWKSFIAWTYADEFSENHLKDLVSRETFGSFVPCAGVGCAFNRRALEKMAHKTGELFPTESLTEDYQLGLHFRQSGLSTIIVHQRLGFGRGEHVSSAAAYVATREFFPDTFMTAVRQKARWIVGICFQAWQQTGWTGNFFTRYTLYRDRKAIIANLFVLVGYAVTILAIVLGTLSVTVPGISKPRVDPRWYPLLDAVLIFSILRIVQKGYFVSLIYGPRQGFMSVLRIPVAGVINACATARACFLFFRSTITGAPLVWSKTSHSFPTRGALAEYRRQLGEVLIEQELVSNEDVSVALTERLEGERIGETLVRLGYLTQRQLTGAVARQIGAEDGSRDDLVATKDALEFLSHEEALHRKALPLRVTDRGVLVAIDDEPSADLDEFLKERLQQPYYWMMVESARLMPAIERSYAFGDERRKPLGVYLLDKEWITRAQLEHALEEQDRTRRGLFELLVERGVLNTERWRTVMEDYFSTQSAVPPRDAKVASGVVALIPTRVLRDSLLVPYLADGKLFVASQFPVDRATKQLINEAFPGATYVATPKDVLMHLRRDVLKLTEKRKQLGQLLVDEKLVSNEDIARAMLARAEGERLGETLVRLGILGEDAISGALARQSEAARGGEQTPGKRPPIGAFLVEKQYITRVQLDELLQRQDKKKLPIFAMAIEDQIISHEQAGVIIESYFERSYEDVPAGADVPLEYLQVIPTKLLRDHTLAVYAVNGSAVIAAPYPLPDDMRDRISKAAGSKATFALCSTDAIAPLRRDMLRKIDIYEINAV